MSKYAIVATMRNEAPTLIEWLAHHMAVGFDCFLVFTNNCQDGTPEILERISTRFPVRHRDNPPPYKDTIQKQALHLARQDDIVSSAEWCLHIDADEYVNVTVGNRQISDLTSLHPDADAITLMWRFFGNSGVKTWTPGRILDQFTMCEGSPALSRMNFKTIFRPSKFRLFSPHMPKLPHDPEALRVVNTAGVPMPTTKMLTKLGSGYEKDMSLASWENAALHHYHVKPDDLHRAKYARGDANGRKNEKRKIGGDYYNGVNCNDAQDASILFYRDRAMEIEREMRDIPGVQEAEQGSLRWLKENYSL